MVEHLHARVRLDRGQTETRTDLTHQVFGTRVVQRLGHAALPQPPGQRVRGQTGAAARLGERVQRRVRGRVVALALPTEQRPGGGEQHERRQVHVPGELVQVPGGIGLRGEHPVHLLGGQGLDGAVVGHARGVHDGGHRFVRRYGFQQRRDRGAIADVARGNAYVGAQRGQLGDQLLDTRRGEAAARDEQQAAHPVPGDQVACGDGAQSACAAGDQDRAVTEVPAGRFEGGRTHQPRRQRGAAADRELWFVRGDRGGDPPGQVREVVVVEVDLHDAPRVFRLRTAYQAADGRCRGVRRLAGQTRSVAGQHDQRGVGAARLGEPVAQYCEGVVHGGAEGRGDVVAVRRRRFGRPDDSRAGVAPARRERRDVLERLGAARDGSAQCDQVPVRHRGRRHRRPVDGVERAAGTGESGRVRGAGEHGVDRQHRGAGGVAGVDAHLLGTRTDDAGADRGGAGPEHTDAVEGERKRQPAVGEVLGEHVDGSVEGRVQERRMHPEARRPARCRLVQGHLGEHVVTTGPGGAHVLEARAVAESQVGEPVVQTRSVDRRAVGRRPVGVGPVRCHAVGGGEGAGGVQRPVRLARLGALGSGGGTRVDRQASAAGVIGFGHRELHVHGSVTVEQQRRRQDEFVHDGQFQAATRGQREIHEPGAGQEHCSEGRVVGDPRVVGGGEPAAEQPFVTTGERRGDAQHRMVERGETGAAHVTERVVVGLHPVPALLEGVDGQVEVGDRLSR